MSDWKVYVFEKTLREEVVARTEEEARDALTDGDEWELIDARDPTWRVDRMRETGAL